MDFRAALGKHNRIALDTNILIYEFESNPRYSALTAAVFRWLESLDHRCVTSTLAMVEILVKPYQSYDATRPAGLFAMLSAYPQLEWIAPDLEIAHRAAEFRARYRMGLVDAVQAATALQSGATCLVGNDAAFKRVPGLEVLLLDDFIRP